MARFILNGGGAPFTKPPLGYQFAIGSSMPKPFQDPSFLTLCTWNVNGLRASLGKGLLDYLRESEPDVVAIQETKTNAPVPDIVLPGYQAVWCFAEKPGYSGTLCLFKEKPLAVTRGLGDTRLDSEGRLITLEYPSHYFVCVYVPNSKGGLDRWYYRLDWDKALLEYLEALHDRKPVIVGGDLNVARSYIDVYPENLLEADPHGFLTEERDGLNALLEMGLVDVFRELHPDLEGAYSWWSSRLNRRSENKGWRLDYFLTSAQLLPKVRSCKLRPDVFGSDHAPIELVIAL